LQILVRACKESRSHYPAGNTIKLHVGFTTEEWENQPDSHRPPVPFIRFNPILPPYINFPRLSLYSSRYPRLNRLFQGARTRPGSPPPPPTAESIPAAKTVQAAYEKRHARTVGFFSVTFKIVNAAGYPIFTFTNLTGKDIG
jgi:hypothetical protein